MNLVAIEPAQRYLEGAPLIDLDAEPIAAFADRHLRGLDPAVAAELVFRFVRDDVAHSWDIQGTRVTRSATEVLAYREGICYAKSHLVAALLRRAGIPTAIGYQKLTLFDDASSGHVIHALNAVYLESAGRWVRFDARGNKPGVDAQFSLGAERLAFPVRAWEGEADDGLLYATPHPDIVATLEHHDDALEMYRTGLPRELAPPERSLAG